MMGILKRQEAVSFETASCLFLTLNLTDETDNGNSLPERMFL
jgi:hypothetical protein